MTSHIFCKTIKINNKMLPFMSADYEDKIISLSYFMHLLYFYLEGNFTLFAPSDAAFKRFPLFLKNNITFMRDVVKFHVATQKIQNNVFQFPDDFLVDTLLPGHQLRLNRYDFKFLTEVCIPFTFKKQYFVSKKQILVTTSDIFKVRGLYMNMFFYYWNY